MLKRKILKPNFRWFLSSDCYFSAPLAAGVRWRTVYIFFCTGDFLPTFLRPKPSEALAAPLPSESFFPLRLSAISTVLSPIGFPREIILSSHLTLMTSSVAFLDFFLWDLLLLHRSFLENIEFPMLKSECPVSWSLYLFLYLFSLIRWWSHLVTWW